MRALIAALALCSASPALAADVTDPLWASAPGRADWARVYPSQAAQAGRSGVVTLHCVASSEGSLADCKIVGESPSNEGFGAAALSLAATMQLKPSGADGQPVGGRSLTFPVKFTPDVLNPHTVITNPDWLYKPSQETMAQYWPAAARLEAGEAVIHCVVTNRGLLDRCAVAHEDPAGRGFGQSALAMSESFVMRPMTIDGQPVGGGEINIPIRWMGGGGGSSDGAVRVIRDAPWIATPTAAQVAQAFPHGALGRVAAAHVVMRCGLSSDGGLRDCDIVSEAPPEKRFGEAAQALAKDFKAMAIPQMGRLTDLKLDVPVTFVDPSRPGQPLQIENPTWIRRIDPAAVVQLFPEAAIKAGYKTGFAELECAVAHDGSLTGCAVEVENPSGFGFGATALKIASVMQMNPWVQGSPVDGARIRLPIRLVMAPDEPPATAPRSPPASH